MSIFFLILLLSEIQTISLIIESIYIQGNYVFNLQQQNIDNLDTMPMDDLDSIVIYLCRIVNLRLDILNIYLYDNIITRIVILTIIAVYLLIPIITLSFSLIKSHKTNIYTNLWITLFRMAHPFVISFSIASVIIVYIQSILNLDYNCNLPSNSNNINTPDIDDKEDTIIEITIASLLLIINYILCITLHLIYTPIMRGQNYTGMKSSYLNISNTILKFVLFVFNVTPNFTFKSVILFMIILFWIIIRDYILFHHLYFFSIELLKTITIINGITTSTIISIFIHFGLKVYKLNAEKHQITGNETLNGQFIYILIIFTLILIPIYNNIMIKRLDICLLEPTNIIKTAYTTTANIIMNTNLDHYDNNNNHNNHHQNKNTNHHNEHNNTHPQYHPFPHPHPHPHYSHNTKQYHQYHHHYYISESNLITKIMLYEYYLNFATQRDDQSRNIYTSELYLEGILTKHIWSCEDCIRLRNYELLLNEPIPKFYQLKLHIIQGMLYEALALYPNSFILNCMLIIFLLDMKKNLCKASFMLEKLRSIYRPFNERLILYVLATQIESKIAREEKCFSRDEVLVLISFRENEIMFDELTNLIYQETNDYISFWNEINQIVPDLSNMMKTALRVRKNFKKVSRTWQKYEANIPSDFARPWLLYGIFLCWVKNDPKSGKYHFSVYQKIARKYDIYEFINNIDYKTLFSSRNVILLIRSEKDRLGEVICCSDSIDLVLNYSASSLVSKNINEIIPEFMKDYHDQFMSNFNYSGKSHALAVPRDQFARHKKGYLVPVKLYTAVFPFIHNEVAFIGLLREIKDKISSDCNYIITSENGDILGATKEIYSSYRLKRISNRKIHITSLIKAQPIPNSINKFLQDQNTESPRVRLRNKTGVSLGPKSIENLDDSSEDDDQNHERHVIKRFFRNNTIRQSLRFDYELKKTLNFQRLVDYIENHPQQILSLYKTFRLDESKKFCSRKVTNTQTLPNETVKYDVSCMTKIYGGILSVRIFKLTKLLLNVGENCNNSQNNNNNNNPDANNNNNNDNIGNNNNNTIMNNNNNTSNVVQTLKPSQVKNPDNFMNFSLVSLDNQVRMNKEQHNIKSLKKSIKLQEPCLLSPAEKEFGEHFNITTGIEEYAKRPYDCMSISNIHSYRHITTTKKDDDDIPFLNTNNHNHPNDEHEHEHKQGLDHDLRCRRQRNHTSIKFFSPGTYITDERLNIRKSNDFLNSYCENKRKKIDDSSSSGVLHFDIREDLGDDRLKKNLNQLVEIGEAWPLTEVKENHVEKLIRTERDKKQIRVQRLLSTKINSYRISIKFYIGIILSLICLLAIFAIKVNENNAFDKSNIYLKILLSCDNRANNLINIGKTTRLLWAINQGYVNNSIEQLNLININNYSDYLMNEHLRSSTNYLLSNSTYILNMASYISQEHKDLLFNRYIHSKIPSYQNNNILVNTSNPNIPITMDDLEMNTFEADNLLYNIVIMIRKLNNITYEYITPILEHALNGMLILNIQSINMINNETMTTIQNIKFNIQLFLIILSFIILGIMIFICAILKGLYHKKIKILKSIIEINPHICENYVKKLKLYLNAVKCKWNDEKLERLGNDHTYSPKLASTKGNKNKEQKNFNITGLKLSIFYFFSSSALFFIVILAIFVAKLIMINSHDYKRTQFIKDITFLQNHLYTTNLAIATLYEYVLANASTYVMNQPSGFILNQTALAIKNYEEFYTYFKHYDSALNNQVDFALKGNICTILPPTSQKICTKLGGSPGSNGIFSLNIYINEVINTAWLHFLESNHTSQDIINTFGLKDIQVIEAIFFDVIIPSYSYFLYWLLSYLDDHNKAYDDKFLTWEILSYIAILIIILVIWIPIQFLMRKEKVGLRQLALMMPKTVLVESNIINMILNKNT